MRTKSCEEVDCPNNPLSFEMIFLIKLFFFGGEATVHSPDI